jgi:multimeric flavodoxin WrbA
VETLEKELGIGFTNLDFTLPDKRKLKYTFTESDIVIVGTPVYAGRVPNLLLKFLN